MQDVRPRHLVEVVRRLQAEDDAPRTVRNVYFLAKAMFRDAQIAELVPLGETPAILTRRQLGKTRDADPTWRASAQFTRAELEALIGDERVPLDRRVMYALLGLGMRATAAPLGPDRGAPGARLRSAVAARARRRVRAHTAASPSRHSLSRHGWRSNMLNTTLWIAQGLVAAVMMLTNPAAFHHRVEAFIARHGG